MTQTRPQPETGNRDCLVCGHGAAEHTATEGTCVGVGGICQCHGYNPDEHPAERLARKRDAEPAG